ncbi:MAG: class I SAM-dependent methyltransferase, partial [Pseudomonadota bacterium]
ILEVGFGTGSNLWFAAREGFSVAGIEGSPTAVETARARFRKEGLKGDLRLGDFSELPYDDLDFDLVIDRAALTHIGKKAQSRAISEIHRCLKPGGYFLFNGYASHHSSCSSGRPGPDGVTVEISKGSLVDVGQVRFSSRSDIDDLFSGGWSLNQVQRRDWVESGKSETEIHAEWVVVAQKSRS